MLFHVDSQGFVLSALSGAGVVTHGGLWNSVGADLSWALCTEKVLHSLGLGPGRPLRRGRSLW